MDHSSPTNHSQAVQLNDTNASKRHSQVCPASGAGGLTRLSTDWLFQSAKEIEIEHRGDVYRLRQTALGKLILTK
ncbi:MAG: hemin uptake protein HemP [Alcaligenaceae bacterium]|nr:hemin uptake protein HemP [Alcaligenaceae bacterium]